VADKPAPAPVAEDKPKRGRSSKKAAEETKTETAPTEEEEPAALEPEVDSAYDVDDMRACVTLLCNAKSPAEARELLTKFKVKRVSEIDAGQYGDFVAATAALFDAKLDATVRAMKATRLLGEFAEGDEKDAFVEKFGGEGALTMTDEDFAALQKAAG
jgi:hypothetical protein